MDRIVKWFNSLPQFVGTMLMGFIAVAILFTVIGLGFAFPVAATMVVFIAVGTFLALLIGVSISHAIGRNPFDKP